MIDFLFSQILSLTRISALVISIVCILRLCLKNAPRRFSYALWFIVLFRLLCPISPETPFSLIPNALSGTGNELFHQEAIFSGSTLDDTLSSRNAPEYTPVSEVSLPSFTETEVEVQAKSPFRFSLLWGFGATCIILYTLVSYILLRRRLLCAVRLHDNVYLTDHAQSPFVVGVFRTKIYLPASLPEKEYDGVLLHERQHIRRGDPIVKLLFWTALCLHWFNPLVWLAFVLCIRDMEMSCDEAVLRQLDKEARADYAASLVSLATGHRIIAGIPLAFDEGNVRERIRNIAKWKKPSLWISVVAGAACLLMAVCLVTNPVARDTMLMGAEYRIEETVYRIDDRFGDYTDADSPSICITADYCLWERIGTEEWKRLGQMESCLPDTAEQYIRAARENRNLSTNRIGKITDAYLLTIHDENAHNFFLAFCTGKGEIFIGYGIRGTDNSSDVLYWLCRLQNDFASSGNTGMFLDRSLTSSVGGDVDIFSSWHDTARHPGYVVVAFRSDISPYSDAIVLPSSEKPNMGYAVFCHNRDETGYRLLQCHVYPDAALAENGIFFCPDPVILDTHGESTNQNTMDVLLLNNDRIEKTTRVWEYEDGSQKQKTDSYLSGSKMVLYSRKNENAPCRVWQYFFNRQGKRLSFYTLVKSDTRMHTRTWVDFYRTHGVSSVDTVDQITIPDYPDVLFTYTPEQVYATFSFNDSEAPGNAHVILFSGAPIRNVFFSDLTGDGLSELCATVSTSSDNPDTYVVVCEYQTGKTWTLRKEGVWQYALCNCDGQLLCERWTNSDSTGIETGQLTLKDDTLHFSPLTDTSPT